MKFLQIAQKLVNAAHIVSIEPERTLKNEKRWLVTLSNDDKCVIDAYNFHELLKVLQAE